MTGFVNGSFTNRETVRAVCTSHLPNDLLLQPTLKVLAPPNT